jgi:ABC-type multidrug transport system ATPase subunit
VSDPEGCGKSTLLALLGGRTSELGRGHCASGTISADGAPFKRAFQRSIAFVPQASRALVVAWKHACTDLTCTLR